MSRTLDDILTPEFGALLRQAREGKGLRLEDVATKLRIQVHYLHAMETGNVKALPPNPYRSAFIKQYASTLGVKLTAPSPSEPKPDTIAKATEIASSAAKATVEAMQSASKATETAVKKSVTGVKEALDELTSRELWEEAEQVRRERLGLDNPPKQEPSGLKVKEVPSSERRRYAAPPPPATPAIAEEDEEYDEIYPQRMSRSAKVIIGLLVVATCVVLYFVFFNTSTKQLQVVGQSQVPPVTAELKDTATTTEPVSSVGDSMVLRLTAKEPVWISVTPDNRPGFRGMLETGMTKTFTAATQYILYLGNQHALDIVFDGRKLSQLPSIPNSKVVVRGLVLTREKVYTDTASRQASTTVAPVKKDTVRASTPPVEKPKPKEIPIDQLPGPIRRRPPVQQQDAPVIKLDTSKRPGQ